MRRRVLPRSAGIGAGVTATLLGLALATAGCGPRQAGHDGAASGETPARADATSPSGATPGVDGPRDSVRELDLGEGQILPRTRILHPEIDECSGIVYHDDAYWVHNDSGAEPILYRSRTLDFGDAEVLRVPGAIAIDWEEIATFGDDLLVFDIGDNRRRRASCTIYRVRYADGALTTVATYPFRYPDGAHDAEAATTIDGRIHIITKDRGEGAALVFRFDELRDASELAAGALNVPTLIGRLDLGEFEQATAATFDEETRSLVVLTYAEIAVYPVDRLDGTPQAATRIWARQAEAVCLADGALVVVNEERDVFTVDDFVERELVSLVPPRASATLPGAGRWADVPLRNLSADEHLRWRRDQDTLFVSIDLRAGNAVPTTAERRGSFVILLFGSEESRRPHQGHVALAVGIDADDEAIVRRLRIDRPGNPLEPVSGVTGTGGVTDGRLQVALRIQRATLFPDWWPEAFLFDVQADEMHADGPEPYFSALGIYSIYRPYTWGRVTVEFDPR